MTIKTTILTSIFVHCLLVNIFGNDLEAYFFKGNEYYQDGNYKAAIEAYTKILDSGYESWEVYYNLGDAYFKDKQIAKAIINFERAKRLNPKDEDINYNLELANLAIVDRIQEIPDFFLLRWISSLAYSINFGVLGGITIALYFVLTLLIIMRMFLKSPQFKRTAFAASIASAAVLLFLALVFSIRIIDNETKVEAIVVNDKVDVKSAPGEAGTDVFALHEGVKVKIQDKSGSWLKIRLADGKVGWLQQEFMEEI